jgi:hypothetical protein
MCENTRILGIQEAGLMSYSVYRKRNKQRCLLGKKSVTRSSVVPSFSCAFLFPSISLALYLNMYL